MRREDAGLAEHPRVRDGTADIVGEKALVERDGRRVFEHELIGVFAEAAAPQLHALASTSLARTEYASSPRPDGFSWPACSVAYTVVGSPYSRMNPTAAP